MRGPSITPSPFVRYSSQDYDVKNRFFPVQDDGGYRPEQEGSYWGDPSLSSRGPPAPTPHDHKGTPAFRYRSGRSPFRYRSLSQTLRYLHIPVPVPVPGNCQTACDDRLKAGPLRESRPAPGFMRGREKIRWPVPSKKDSLFNSP